MDLSLLIFLHGLLGAVVYTATPSYCHFENPLPENGREDGLTLSDFALEGLSGALKTTETTEPDASGDTEMTSGEATLGDGLATKSVELTPEATTHLSAKVEAVLAEEVPLDSVQSELGADAKDANTSERSADEKTSEDDEQNDVNSYLKELFGEVSTDYIDDYNKSDGGKNMDPEKEYSFQTVVPLDDLLILAAPTGCVLLDQSSEKTPTGLQAFEVTFKNSSLQDCTELTNTFMEDVTQKVAEELALSRGSSTKMVEISVRDPKRNRELNIRETTEVFSNPRSTGMNTDEEVNEFADDLRHEFEVVPTEEDRKYAEKFVANYLNMDLYPTSQNSVMVLGFSMKPEVNVNEEELAGDLYTLMKRMTEKTGGEGEQASEATDENASFDNLFRKLANLPRGKLASLVEQVKKLLDTEEGKQVMEKFNKEVAKRVEDTKKVLDEEVTMGKKILDDLSKHGVDNVECTKLSMEDCKNYSKCEVMNVEGKDMCFVSPKTIIWLHETNCGLQSRPALLSIARDLKNVGIMSPKRVNMLEQSFNLRKICRSITHSYLSRLAPKSDQQPNNAFN